MKTLDYVAALDIGTWYTKLALWIRPEQDDQEAKIYYAKARSRGVQRGTIVNRDDLVGCIEELLAQYEHRFNFRIRTVHVAYFGEPVQLIQHQARVTCHTTDPEAPALTVVSEKDLEHLEEQVRQYQPPPQTRIFDREIIQHTGDKGRIECALLGAITSFVRAEYNLYAAPEDQLQILQAVVRGAGLEIASIRFPPRLIPGLILGQADRQLFTATLSVGAYRSLMCIYDDGKLLELYHLDLHGGIEVTEKIAEHEGYNFNRAESLKCGRVDLNVSGRLSQNIPDEFRGQARGEAITERAAGAIFFTMKEVAFLISERNRYASQLRNGNGIYIYGGGFLYKHCEVYMQALSERINLHVGIHRSQALGYSTEPLATEQGAEPHDIYIPVMALVYDAIGRGELSSAQRHGPNPEAEPIEPAPTPPQYEEEESSETPPLTLRNALKRFGKLLKKSDPPPTYRD